MGHSVRVNRMANGLAREGRHLAALLLSKQIIVTHVLHIAEGKRLWE